MAAVIKLCGEANKLAQPGMTSIKSSSGTVELYKGVPGEPETAVEHKAAKIIFENIWL